MKFNVGPGIEAKMLELGDYAVRPSKFFNSLGSVTTEFGYGMKYDYRASNASGDWEIIAYALPLIQ